MSKPKQLVWLITGTSSGIGRELAIAVLERGDHVIATTRARSFDALCVLNEGGATILELDVTAPLEKLESIAADAVKIYGRVDVLVNNAGAYTTPGTLEDQTPEDTLNQFNINVFGPLNVARAFLPYMRQRRSGTVAWLGSVSAYTHVLNCGLYSATKAALTRISEALNSELEPFNVRSICFEFGFFRSGLTQPDRVPPLKQRIPEYKELSEQWNKIAGDLYHTIRGDTAKGVQVLVDAVRGEGGASEKQVPSRFAVGPDAYAIIKDESAKAMQRLDDWQEVICSTDIDDVPAVAA